MTIKIASVENITVKSFFYVVGVEYIQVQTLTVISTEHFFKESSSWTLLEYVTLSQIVFSKSPKVRSNDEFKSPFFYFFLMAYLFQDFVLERFSVF